MRILRAIAAHPTGRIGAGIILLYLLLALCGTIGFTPHDPLQQFRIDRLQGPTMAMMSSAKRIAGKASSTSMERMKSPSSQPPHHPASRPIMVPARLANPTEAKAMTKDWPMPTISRLAVSRPNRSVPMR